MLTTALLLLLAAAWFFVSGRLLLAFLPPGWPGWAPGLGAREFAATVGVSWLLGVTLYWTLGGITNLWLIGADQAEAAAILSVQTLVYLGVHALFLIAALLRAPAKLRPRHELAPSRTGVSSLFLALTVVVAATVPAVIRLDAIRGEVSASEVLTSAQVWRAFMGEVSGDLVPLALALVLVGALARLNIASWAAWLAALGGLVAGLLMSHDPGRAFVAFNRLEPGPRSMQTFFVAVALGLVWARTADRRARTIALLLLALLPLAANVGVTVMALVGLCIVRFAMPSGDSVRWPWILWIACACMPIVHYYWMVQDVWEHGDVTLTFHAASLAFPDFDHWRWWVTPPIAVIVACLLQSRRSSSPDERRLVRVAWWLVILAPALLALIASLKNAIGFVPDGGFPYSNGEQHVTLRYFVLGWTPALLLLVAALFAPRNARESKSDESPS